MDLLCNEVLLGKGIDEVASLGGELSAEADAYVLIACGGKALFLASNHIESTKYCSGRRLTG